MFRRCQRVAAIAVFVLAAMSTGRAADQLQLRVLSSRPDMVTGGDALVRVELPAGVTAADVKLTVNGADATKQLKADASAPRGARLVVSLLHELRRRGGRYGLATMCVGVGQGQAALFERPAT